MTGSAQSSSAQSAQLRGAVFVIAVIMTAFGNLMAILDLTVANVSVPSIAAGLGASPREGTWAITAYAVAEAISVPLTGWLALRFGTARAFVFSLSGFGLASALCGLAPSLKALVIFRVIQGLAGGPMVPLSQTLLMGIFPKDKTENAMAAWTMTAVIGPIIGPVVGGFICDNFSWPWVFLINVPFAASAAFVCYRYLVPRDPAPRPIKVDIVGLGLLVVWVGCLQMILDRGQELDWLGSPLIDGLAVIAVIAFAAFLIWELTETNPIVDLRVFRHAGYSLMLASLTLTTLAWFGHNLISTLWLQTNMGATALMAGWVIAPSGIVIFLCAPLMAPISRATDLRLLYSAGMFLYVGILWIQSHFPPDVPYGNIVLLYTITGVSVSLFFAPAMSIALSFVEPRELPGAAGLLSFARTAATAITTSVSTALWQDRATHHQSGIADAINGGNAIARLGDAGLKPHAALNYLDSMVHSQSVTAATDDIFLAYCLCMGVSGLAVWLIPRRAPMLAAAASH
jgi:DHA2 family multidrug resistance protein